MLLGNAWRPGELPSIHRRGTDVARLASLDDVVQRLERLLDWRIIIPAVDLVEVDIIHTQPSEAGVDLGEDCLARQPGAVRAGPHAPIDLCGDDHFVATGKVPCRATEDLLALAERVAIGGVEEIDPRLQRALDEGPVFLFAEAPRVVASVAAAIAHAPQANTRDIQAGAAELGVFNTGAFTPGAAV